MNKVIFIILFVCNTSIRGQKLKVDMSNFFTEQEILDLNKLTDFFQDELCDKSNGTDFKRCFLKSIPLGNELYFESLSEQISYRKQKRIFKSISDSTFNKIWNLCPTTILISIPEYEFLSICFSGNNKLMEFLNAIGEQNEYVKYYAERLDNIGEFDHSYLLTENIKTKPEEWDLEDRNIQVFLAIHFLTQNDIENRNKKAKRLERKYNRKMIKKIRKN